MLSTRWYIYIIRVANPRAVSHPPTEPSGKKTQIVRETLKRYVVWSWRAACGRRHVLITSSAETIAVATFTSAHEISGANVGVYRHNGRARELPPRSCPESCHIVNSEFGARVAHEPVWGDFKQWARKRVLILRIHVRVPRLVGLCCASLDARDRERASFFAEGIPRSMSALLASRGL